MRTKGRGGGCREGPRGGAGKIVPEEQRKIRQKSKRTLDSRRIISKGTNSAIREERAAQKSDCGGSRESERVSKERNWEKRPHFP